VDARLPLGRALPTGFDLAQGTAAITIVGVAVIAILTLIPFENAVATGAHRGG